MEGSMKKQMIFAAILLASMPQVKAEVTLAPVKHLYVPNGFDSNDSVEVVVTGNFPNPCYSRNTVSVDVKGDQIAVEVSAIRRDTKAACPMMLVPFKEVVSVGNLQGGTYDIVVNDKLTETLTISESTSNSIDDHLYAAIDQVEQKGANEYVLQGWRYSNCIDIDRVDVVSNGKDTLSVLPVMKQLSSFCPMKMMPVAYSVKLDFSNLKTKEPLIHVRTMDGKSYNTVLNLEGLK
jgi:hypothetical protein